MTRIKPSDLAATRALLAERDGWSCHYCAVPVGEATVPAPPLAVLGGHCGCGLGRINPDMDDLDAPSYGSIHLCGGCVHCAPSFKTPPGVQLAYIDHVVPRAKGGSNELPNLVLACNPCNSRKGARDYEVFIAEIGRR